MYLIRQGDAFVKAANDGWGYISPCSGGPPLPPHVIDAMGDAELAGYGFVRVEEPAPQAVPFGKRLSAISYSIAKDGTVTAKQTLEDVPLEDLKAARKAAVGDKRWQVETGGCQVAPGVTIRTDETSQSKLDGAIALLDKAAARGLDVDPVLWEAQPGQFVELDQEGLTLAGLAVGMFVQATFRRKAALFAAIDAATSVDELAAIDIDSGWPT